MKIQPITNVIGIRIEISLAEAMQIVQNRQKGDRLVDEMETILRASGVDPETGEKVPTVLGLQAASFKSLASPAEIEELESKPFECPHCSKTAKTESGLKVHITRMHPKAQAQEEIDELEEEPIPL